MLAFINVGVPPTFLGLMILLLEGLGSVSLFSGYFFRIACLVLFLLFGLYFFNYFSTGYNTLMLWSSGIATVFLGLIFLGPGRYALRVKLKK
jgi:putative oxidoreductase